MRLSWNFLSTASIVLIPFLSSIVTANGAPGCASSCLGPSYWNTSNCASQNGWACLCGSSDLDNVNNCVASSCTSTSDQEAIYAALAQICANISPSLSTTFTSLPTPESTFHATPSGTLASSLLSWTSNYPASWWSTSCLSSLSTALPSPPSDWAGSGPWGGWGGEWSSWGPGAWSSAGWGWGAGASGSAAWSTADCESWSSWQSVWSTKTGPWGTGLPGGWGDWSSSCISTATTGTGTGTSSPAAVSATPTTTTTTATTTPTAAYTYKVVTKTVSGTDVVALTVGQEVSKSTGSSSAAGQQASSSGSGTSVGDLCPGAMMWAWVAGVYLFVGLLVGLID